MLHKRCWLDVGNAFSPVQIRVYARNFVASRDALLLY